VAVVESDGVDAAHIGVEAGSPTEGVEDHR
jgi:hypothetical protein